MHDRLPRVRRHLPAVLFLLGIVLFLFRLPLFAGFRFIGNSDRWNHHLSFVAFHSDNLARRAFAAWSNYLLMGFDTLAMPGNFPSPLFLLPALLRTRDVVTIMGYVAMATLGFTLVTVYLVLQDLCRDRLAAVTGAVVFSLSIFSLLKLSQNDDEYLPFALIPIFFHLLRTTSRQNLGGRIVSLTVLVWLCAYVFFLQPFAYVIIFLLSYTCYLSLTRRHAPLTALIPSLALGVLLAAPRIALQFEDIMHSSRTSQGIIEEVSPALFLRYLNGNIFGRSWREAYNHHAINLSEGNLLFASVFASLLLLFVVMRGRYTARVPGQGDVPLRYGFFIGFIVFVILVTHFLPAYTLFSLLFLNISFLHTRFNQAALFPIALVSSLYLTRDGSWSLNWRRALLIAGLASGIILVGLAPFDPLSRLLVRPGRPSGLFVHVPGSPETAILLPELLRWLALAAIFGVLLLARWPLGFLSLGTLKTVVAVMIIIQAVLAADYFLSGPQTRNYTMPFERYDDVMATPDDFLPPTADQIRRMHEWLDNDHYRSVVLCPWEVISVDCSTSIGMKWKIRLADGYLHGVSARYMSLPWREQDRTVRSIRFSSLYVSHGWKDRESLAPWRLLSLLNVRNVLVVSPELFSNKGGRAPYGVLAIRNPSPHIYRRAYFSSKVQSVTPAEAREAIRKYFSSCEHPRCSQVLETNHPVDYVEGSVDGNFDAAGEIIWTFSGDTVVLNFPPSPHRRFLVVNEAYHRRWKAYATGKSLEVYPTNVVMRGVLVPARTARITMRFHSVIEDTFKYLSIVIPLIGISALILRRHLGQLFDRVLVPNGDRHQEVV